MRKVLYLGVMKATRRWSRPVQDECLPEQHLVSLRYGYRSTWPEDFW